MGATKKWIQGAIKHPGAFGKKASKAHMGTMAFADKMAKPGSKASPKTKKQAVLAKTLKGFNHKKKK